MRWCFHKLCLFPYKPILIHHNRGHTRHVKTNQARDSTIPYAIVGVKSQPYFILIQNNMVHTTHYTLIVAPLLKANSSSCSLVTSLFSSSEISQHSVLAVILFLASHFNLLSFLSLSGFGYCECNITPHKTTKSGSTTPRHKLNS